MQSSTTTAHSVPGNPAQQSTEEKIIQALNNGDKDFSKILREAKLTSDELLKLLKRHENPRAKVWKDKEPRLSKFVMRLVEDDAIDLANKYSAIFKACFKEEPLLSCFGQVRSAAMVACLKLTGAKMVPTNKETESALVNFIAYSQDAPKIPEKDAKEPNPAKTVLESLLFWGKDANIINYVGACGTALDWALNKEKYNSEWKKVVEFLISQGAKPAKEISNAESKARVDAPALATNLKTMFTPIAAPQISPAELRATLASVDLMLERVINSPHAFQIKARLYGDVDKFSQDYPLLFVLVPRFTKEQATQKSLLQFIQNANETQMRDSLFFANSHAEFYRDMYCRRDITDDQYDLHIFTWNNIRPFWQPEIKAELLKDVKKTFQKLGVIARCVESTDKMFDRESVLTFQALKPKAELNLEYKASPATDQTLQPPLVETNLSDKVIMSALDEIFKVTSKKCITVPNVRNIIGDLETAQIIGEGFFRGISFMMPGVNLSQTQSGSEQTPSLARQNLFSTQVSQDVKDTASAQLSSETKDVTTASAEPSRAEKVEYVIKHLLRRATPPRSFLSALPLSMRGPDFVEPPEPKVPSESEAKIPELIRARLLPKAPKECTASIIRDETIVDSETLDKIYQHYKAVEQRVEERNKEWAIIHKRFS